MIDSPLATLDYDRLRDSAGENGVIRVLPQRKGDFLHLYLRCRIGGRRRHGIEAGGHRRHKRGRQVKQLARFNELRVLLTYGPDRSGGEEKRGASALESSLQNSFPAGDRWPGRPAYSHVCKLISGSCLTLVELEVGHGRFGCTSYATLGMEIALPPVPASGYTDQK